MEMIGISDRHLPGVEKERNYPSVELLIRPAKRYHVSIDQLISADSQSKSTARRNTEATLDKLNDQQLRKREVSALVKIADYFGVSTDYLLGLSDVKSFFYSA